MKAEEGAIIGYILVDPETKRQVRPGNNACRIYKSKYAVLQEAKKRSRLNKPVHIHAVFLGPEVSHEF